MMRNFYRTFILFLLLQVVGSGLWVVQAAGTNFSPQQQEQIFLHHDRDIYVAGEHVFFKMQATTPRLSQMEHSRIAYLVLRNARSRNVLELSVKLDAKGAWSAFVLPDTLSTGHYELVAFTNYMRNYGEEHFFRKQLFVANRFDGEIALIERFNEGYQALPPTFFPEGGQLIDGVTSKVAVVAGNSGIRAGETAWLTNSRADTLQPIRFDNPDFTVFTFTPEPEESYFLVLNDGTRFALPRAARQGSGLFVTEQQGQLDIQLLASFDQPDTYSLEVHSADNISRQRLVSLHHQPLGVSFSEDELPDGMLNLLLKDAKGKVVARRLWYNKPLQQASLKIELTGTRPAVRRQVPLQVTSHDMELMPVSVAVVQRDLCFDHQKKILNQLLLKQYALAGYQRLAELANSGSLQVAFNDLLMVAAAGNLPAEQQIEQQDHVYVQEMQGFNLSGKLVEAQSNQGIANALIYLSSPDSLLNFNYATTLEDGSFYFLLDDYYHGKELILQVADQHLTETSRIRVADRFELKQPFTPMVFADVNDHLEAIVNLQKIVAVQKHYGMQGEVVSQSADLPVLVPRPLFYHANQVVVPAEYVALDNFREIAREIIFSLRIRQDAGGRYTATLVNARERGFFEQAPMFFLDAVPVPDISQIMDLSSNELQRIDVHNIPWIYGDLSFDGIISLVSRNRKYQQLEFPASAARVNAPVYASRLVFQPEAYQEDHSPNMRPDFRPMLAWLPELMPGEQQPAEASFVCGDLKGDYIIIVNGIDGQGIPVSQSFYFEVK